MIVSITRWWLLSAYFLADLLGIKSIETINIASYDERESWDIKDETKIKKDFSGFNCLIIDDLVGSGKTMNYILHAYKFTPENTKIAVIFTKAQATLKPDYFVEEIPANQRVSFPYER